MWAWPIFGLFLPRPKLDLFYLSDLPSFLFFSRGPAWSCFPSSFVLPVLYFLAPSSFVFFFLGWAYLNPLSFFLFFTRGLGLPLFPSLFYSCFSVWASLKFISPFSFSTQPIFLIHLKPRGTHVMPNHYSPLFFLASFAQRPNAQTSVTGRIQTPKPTLTDQFLPFTGRNTPLRTSPASQNLQSLEEMVTSGGSCCSLNLGRRKGGMYADLAGTGLVQRGRFG